MYVKCVGTCILSFPSFYFISSLLFLSTLLYMYIPVHMPVYFFISLLSLPLSSPLSFSHIQVTTMQRDVSSGTALQEISFWVSMDHALNRILAKRDSPEVVLTLDVLKAGKRFHTTLSFDSDTGLKNTLDKVMDYILLMKDFPIKDLLAADTLPLLTNAIGKCVLGELKY